MTQAARPEEWGLNVGAGGDLHLAGQSIVELARIYGTPIHILHEDRLFESARRFRETAERAYQGRVSVHYPFKCNAVPGVVAIVRRAGLRAEVMTEFELALALELGFDPGELIVNGPCKTGEFLRQCIAARVRFIIVDALEELLIIQKLAEQANRRVDILLRVNPDYVPGGMNSGSATGSRKGCAFGLDLKGGEVRRALGLLHNLPFIRFQGYHCHIGTGVRRPEDFVEGFRWLPSLAEEAQQASLSVRVIDVGGGFATPRSREFTSAELVLYQAFGRLPSSAADGSGPAIADFTGLIAAFVTRTFSGTERPELIYEPGRCITSPHQCLLLTVHRVKDRAGCGTWVITDGGLGTLTLPTYYEYHELFLANEVYRGPMQRVSIVGPACFAGDVVYRNKRFPDVHVGEVLALMDTGAYFTQWESSFGFYRPPVVAVSDRGCRVLRSRETFEDAVARDRTIQQLPNTEVRHEIHHHHERH